MTKLILILLALSASAFAIDFDPKNPAPYIKEMASPLNWETLGNIPEKVLYIGEDHFSTALKKELADHFGVLKTLGYTHLGIEVLSDDTQPLLDEFMKNGSKREAILSQIHDHGWGHDHYMMVFEAARAAGLRLVGLNLLYDPHYSVDENVTYRCRDKARAGHPCSLKQSACSIWDCWMASVINQELSENKNAKMVVLIGNTHTFKTGQPRFLIQDHGIESRSYIFTFPKKTSDSYQQAFNQAIQDLGLGQSKIFVPLPWQTGKFDGMIYLPDVYDGK